MVNQDRPFLSVIVPFSNRLGDKTGSQRLLNAVQCFQGIPQLEIIVFDTSRDPQIQLQEQLHKIESVHYFSCVANDVFSPGKTRNLAVEKANGEYLFFYDADLLCSEEFARQIVSRARLLQKGGVHHFEMFPCLYLNKKTTYSVLHGSLPDYPGYLQSYLKGYLEQVDGIAVASSCLLVNKQWFLAIGGFRSEFSGYGCEDLELIHRLTAYFPIGKKPDDYLIDLKVRFPGAYQGFRRYYSYYSLPHLFQNRFLLHQWHSRPVNKYHKQRAQNEQFQQQFMNTVDISGGSLISVKQCKLEQLDTWHSDRSLPEWQMFIEGLLVSNHFSPDEYCGLFRLAEGVQEQGVTMRKIKKFLRNPQLFISDARNNWFSRFSSSK